MAVKIPLSSVFVFCCVEGMGLIEIDDPGSAVPGVRWHKPSGTYVAEIGYHKFNHIAADVSITTSRIRSSQQLGPSEAEAVLCLYSLNQEWGTVKKQWRKRRNHWVTCSNRLLCVNSAKVIS
jgi:hypothetical protein